ncbi:MAG: nucleotidyl transferase AbiEii/AbiGii toxin family protein [Anaerolineales bacterium]
MLDFNNIKEQYPLNLQRFERAILREYLQYKLLQAVFESPYASKLSFMGGTALRIIHNNNRFSEDIELDNSGLSWEEFEEVIRKVQRTLTLEGFIVDIRNVSKGAYRCYLKFPDLLYEQGLSPIRDEKIFIQVDTVAQGYQYEPEIKLLSKFDVFTEVRITPLSVLYSQKIFAAVSRKRPKGRDFFDITYVAGMTKPDLRYIHQKMGLETAEELRGEVASRIEGYDFQKLARDVSPFLIYQEEIVRVEKFKQFWKQVELE